MSSGTEMWPLKAGGFTFVGFLFISFSRFCVVLPEVLSTTR